MKVVMYVNDIVFAHMSSLTEFRSQAAEHFPSLCDHEAYFPLILACYGIYPQTTNYALDEWAPGQSLIQHSIGTAQKGSDT
jgi:hypothetical protein